MNDVCVCVSQGRPCEIFIALVKSSQLVPLDFFTDKFKVPLIKAAVSPEGFWGPSGESIPVTVSLACEKRKPGPDSRVRAPGGPASPPSPHGPLTLGLGFLSFPGL